MFAIARSTAWRARVLCVVLASFCATEANAGGCVEAQPGIVAWWKGETNANDSVGPFNGTLMSGAGFAPGKVGNAFSLDGGVQHVLMGNVLDTGTGDFSVAAWVRKSGTQDANVIRKGNANGGSPPNTGWALVAGQVETDFGVRDGGTTQFASGPALQVGQWYHLVGVLDRGANQIRLYIDGSLAGQQALTALGSLSNGEPLAIGAQAYASMIPPAGTFPGLIDEAQFYPRVLSASEVSQLNAAGAAGGCAAPTDVPPTIAWSPVPGTTVVLGGADTGLGANAVAAIQGIPSGGSGTGPAATTTVGNCQFVSGDFSAFGLMPPQLSFDGAMATPQQFILNCTRGANEKNTVFICDETPGAGTPTSRVWNLTCPAADAAAVPPTLAYAPAAGTPLLMGEGLPIGGIGSGAGRTIVVTPTGGSGAGAGATTVVGDCNYSGAGAAAFDAPPPNIAFVGATTAAQGLPVSCTLAAVQQDALLSCTESAGGGTGVVRSWPVNCPAGVGTTAPPTLAYVPAPGSSVAFAGGSGQEGSEAFANIAATPGGGNGSGAAATTTLSACAFGGADAAAFSGASTLSFTGNTTTADSIALSCTRGAAPRAATLTCTETAGASPGLPRSWVLACPAGAQTAPSSVSLSVTPSRIVGSGTVLLEWNPVNATGCTPSADRAGTTIVAAGTNRANATVAADATSRNDVFRVTCTGNGGPVANTAVLSVGVPPPPPPAEVTNIATTANNQAADGVSRRIALSDGGRFAVFESLADNLVAGDTNAQQDVFVRDTTTGAIVRVGTAGEASGDARITRDGRGVLYTRGTLVPGAAAGAKNFANSQICFNSLATNASQCFSKNPVTGQPGNGASNNGAISANADVVVYESTATNLSPQDTNAGISDVFKYTVSTNTIAVLSLDANSVSANAPSTRPGISCNGREVTFESRAALVNNLPVTPGVRNIYELPSSGGKRLVTFGIDGLAANGDSGRPVVTDDGRYVFFESSASNLVANDTNGVSDVFVADMWLGTIRRMSTSAAGTQGNDASSNPRIPCDGAYLTFESRASNLVASDTNGRADTFIVNMGTGSIALASQDAGGATDGNSGNGELSPDGTAVGFDSDASNLGANGQTSVFAGANPFALQNYTGAWYDPAQAGHGLFLDQLADGRLVAWWFTFDPSGAQAWFGGVGQIQGTSAVVSVVRTQGARFLPNFVASEAVNAPIGTLTFNFANCSSGRVDFALGAPFGNGFMNLSRLTTPLGVTCTPPGGAAPKAIAESWTTNPFFAARTAKAVEPTVGPIAGVTGAWYDPAQPGHGLFVENLGEGRLLMWWFTFGPNGGQSWFGNIATITSGTTASMNFLKTQGGRWIPDFDARQVTNPSLGTATIRFPSCDAGTIEYTLQQGYGTGTMNLRPLLRPVGASCQN